MHGGQSPDRAAGNVALVAGEEVQRDREDGADLSWVWTRAKGLLYEAHHRGHQQAALQEDTRCVWGGREDVGGARNTQGPHLVHDREQAAHDFHLADWEADFLLCFSQRRVHVVSVSGVSSATGETHLAAAGPQLHTHRHTQFNVRAGSGKPPPSVYLF